MSWWIVILALAGCGDLRTDIKSDRPRRDVPATKPEAEPDSETAAERIVAGEDVVVSRDARWLVARRCLWARRDLHACEVVFVEHGRVRGSVPVFDARAPGSQRDQAKRAVRAVRDALDTRVGPSRVALSSTYRYGAERSIGDTIIKVVGDQLEVAELQRQDAPLGRSPWSFGDAVQRNVLRSPRAPGLVVFELHTRPDAATGYAMYRIDPAGTYRLIMLGAPLERGQLPRFPTEAEVRALHAAVWNELEEVERLRPSDHVRWLRESYGRLSVDDWTSTPEQRLDFATTMETLRRKLRTGR